MFGQRLLGGIGNSRILIGLAASSGTSVRATSTVWMPAFTGITRLARFFERPRRGLNIRASIAADPGPEIGPSMNWLFAVRGFWVHPSAWLPSIPRRQSRPRARSVHTLRYGC